MQLIRNSRTKALTCMPRIIIFAEEEEEIEQKQNKGKLYMIQGLCIASAFGKKVLLRTKQCLALSLITVELYLTEDQSVRNSAN